jgi:adenylyltransferase/sulfurtransferase
VSEDRYERLAAIDWWDRAKVRQARAVVVGAGALGNEVVKSLALLGWGTIFIVDHDSVDLSNLTRSVFFRDSDVGGWKAEILADRAREANPDCRVVGLAGDARLMLSAGMVRRSDVVFGCVDNLAARVAISQLVGQAGGLMIDGGLSTWEGTVQLFGPDFTGPCFACGLTEGDLLELNLRQSCLAYARRSEAAGGVPTTPTVTSVTAALMVQEALKWIHRDSCQLPVALGRELRVDLANTRFWNHAIPVNDECVLHPAPVTPEVVERTRWDSSWRDVVRECQLAAGAQAMPLQVPARILYRWDCPACGKVGDSARAYAGDGRVACEACGEDAIPSFTTQVDGSEEWADQTPADLGFPPWTWVLLRTETGNRMFELVGSYLPFEVLDEV